ncbi:Cubilin [Trichoplax sp. H2]|uniref:CUB domain-containing protein n=1 Tax=Trichoplax adhaerens TaxID=10228 RepID=B3RNS9_TRIAD|nr:hypothetical protein TRIADDRAFT_53274 [Trichoplax adhaerens]EDV27515.1 hypothetical protein TRIADDRAFT_53274 [Trichoplax adhaerens]RDD43393.1 Cubilin [Trichoplax sp. H2]|eukprot:XP_002109349.1 hypothetical protein TRIADDRAFT_53274 [Trichoplax adhaerens]
MEKLVFIMPVLAYLVLASDIMDEGSSLEFELEDFDIEKRCDYAIKQNYGKIKSPNYPFFNPSNSSCKYVITTREGKVVAWRWSDFDLPPKVFGHCRESVTAYDGQVLGINQYLFTPICGRYSLNSFDFTSSGNQLSIVLHAKTNQPDIEVYRGFSAYFYSKPYRCNNMVYRTASGAIVSPHFPLAYPPNQDCIYKIQVAPGMIFSLNFAEFALGRPAKRNNVSSVENCDDYVEVYEGLMDPRHRYFRHCGLYKPPQILSGGNIAYIKFHSSKSALSLYTGFRAFYSAAYPDKCGLHYGTASGAMSIPVIPQTDNVDIECQFVVKSREVAYYKIRWLSFGIDIFKHGCDKNNYIEIYDGFYNRKDKLLTKKCDRKLEEINTQYNEMLIRFKIEKFNPTRNFKFLYIGVTDNTVKVITDKNQTCTTKTTIVYRYSGPEIISREVTCKPFTIAGLPVWASILIVIGSSIAGIALLVGGYCVIRRRSRSNESYGRLSRSSSDGSI